MEDCNGYPNCTDEFHIRNRIDDIEYFNENFKRGFTSNFQKEIPYENNMENMNKINQNHTEYFDDCIDYNSKNYIFRFPSPEVRDGNNFSFVVQISPESIENFHSYVRNGYIPSKSEEDFINRAINIQKSSKNNENSSDKKHSNSNRTSPQYQKEILHGSIHKNINYDNSDQSPHLHSVKYREDIQSSTQNTSIQSPYVHSPNILTPTSKQHITRSISGKVYPQQTRVVTNEQQPIKYNVALSPDEFYQSQRSPELGAQLNHNVYQQRSKSASEHMNVFECVTRNVNSQITQVHGSGSSKSRYENQYVKTLSYRPSISNPFICSESDHMLHRNSYGSSDDGLKFTLQSEHHEFQMIDTQVIKRAPDIKKEFKYVSFYKPLKRKYIVFSDSLRRSLDIESVKQEDEREIQLSNKVLEVASQNPASLLALGAIFYLPSENKQKITQRHYEKHSEPKQAAQPLQLKRSLKNYKHVKLRKLYDDIFEKIRSYDSTNNLIMHQVYNMKLQSTKEPSIFSQNKNILSCISQDSLDSLKKEDNRVRKTPLSDFSRRCDFMIDCNETLCNIYINELENTQKNKPYFSRL